MTDFLLASAVVLLGAVLALQIFSLLRRTKADLPVEWLHALQSIEKSTQNTVLNVAKNDGTLSGIALQLDRNSMASAQHMEALGQGVDKKLTQALEESRQSRAEFQTSFTSFDNRLEGRLTAFDTALALRFNALQQGITGRLDENGKALMAHLAQAATDAAQARGELSQTLTGVSSQLTGTLQLLATETTASRAAMEQSAASFEVKIKQQFDALTQTSRDILEGLKSDINRQLSSTSQVLKDQLDVNSQQTNNQFLALQKVVSQQLAGLVSGTQQNADQLRSLLNERLLAIQVDNTNKLEEMRRTVDEKLHATLEQRLGESFKLVSDRLEQVHAGLGEMKTLAGSVGDLKRVMTNVKSRGTWGEMQLGAIIEDVLTKEQYERNVKVTPDSNELVEFAIRLPGESSERPLWIPIDSKYPVEQYQRLLDAYDLADKEGIKSAGNAFETSIKLEAKKISSKYVAPPYTTNFAILYLPTEGLFAEVIRRPGLQEALQNDCRVIITCPSNLTAMLNMLQMGFKTLAIEKRSSEVWNLLSGVKTEFGKFGQIVDETKKSIDAAAKKFEQVGIRTRAIERKLRDVHELELPQDGSLPMPGKLDALDYDATA